MYLNNGSAIVVKWYFVHFRFQPETITKTLKNRLKTSFSTLF